jgi:hypothetical protein
MFSTWWLSNLALAGSVFATTLTGDLYEFNTRNMSSTYRAGGMGIGGYTGVAYDPDQNNVWVLTESPPVDALFRIDATTWSVNYAGYQGVFQHSLAYDPVARMLVTVGDYGVMSLSPFGPYVSLSQTGFRTSSADWFDDGGSIVSIDSNTGTYYAIDPPSAPRALNPWHIPAGMNVLGMAYDKDTKTFWVFNNTGGVDVIEPEGFTAVAVMNAASGYDGAGGSIDDVPNQTPELIISSLACPNAGPALVTVVDATPGGHVQFGSSLQTGNHRIRRGGCAGTNLGLSNPTPRYDLVANSYGIASTRVNFSAAACGTLKIQAVDMDTCLATSVQPVGYAILP